jgi:hypothetical protein
MAERLSPRRACRTVRKRSSGASEIGRREGWSSPLEIGTFLRDSIELDGRYLMSLKLRITLVSAVAAALAASSIALGAGGLEGTFATTIKSPAQLKGTWALVFAKGGKYTVVVNGKTGARGKYSATPRTITMFGERGSECIGAGTYAWKRSGKTVTFTRKRESASCQVRALVLSHRFTKVR